MKFKIGQKVKTKENHEYLGIKKSNVGLVTNIDKENDSVSVQFKKRNIIFCSLELIKK